VSKVVPVVNQIRAKVMVMSTFLFFTALLVVITAEPAFSQTDSNGWEVIQSFKQALEEQESRNQRYLILYLSLLFILAGLSVYWYRVQTKMKMDSTELWKNLDRAGCGTDEQRRAWLRLSMDLYLLYTPYWDNHFKKAKIIDISGGGLLFATDQEFQHKDRLRIIIELYPEEKLNLVGMVTRILENPEQAQGRYLVGVQFLEIKKREQDSIVGQILQKQQRMILEEKRKAKAECIDCGQPLPEGDKKVRTLCPRCRAHGVNTGDV